MYDYCLEENWISSNNIISMLSTWRQNKSIIHGDPTSFTWKHLLAATNQLLIPDAEEQAQVYFFSLWGLLPRGSLCNWQSSCPAVWLGAHLHTCQPIVTLGATLWQGLCLWINESTTLQLGIPFMSQLSRAHGSYRTHHVPPGPKLFLVKVQIGAKGLSREAEKNFPM